MWPHRRQPTRLCRPWDSPGKNTGVSCHFLPQCTKVKSESEVAQSCQTLRDPIDHSLPGSSVHGIFQARVLEWGAITTFTSRNRSYTKAPVAWVEILSPCGHTDWATVTRKPGPWALNSHRARRAVNGTCHQEMPGVIKGGRWNHQKSVSECQFWWVNLPHTVFRSSTRKEARYAHF